MPKKKLLIILTVVLALAVLTGVFFIINRKDLEEQDRRVPDIVPDIRDPGEEIIVHPKDNDIFLQYDRSLVRELGSEEIFWFQNKRFYLILRPKIIDLMVGIEGWDKIETVPPRALEGFSRGPDFIAPGSESDDILIRKRGTDFIFLMEDGQRTYLRPKEFEGRGYALENVIEVDARIIKKLPPSEDIDHLSLRQAIERGNIQLIGSGEYFEEGVVFIAGPYKKDTAINIEKGDVLLSKEGKQSLVVTQDFEVFVPKDEEITLRGLWVACIDRFKDWPSADDVLDVTLNIKDWGMASAFQLYELIKIIDEKEIHREQFAQDAIWKITDNIKVGPESRGLLRRIDVDPEVRVFFPRLSNPAPPPTTRFIISPEISLPGRVANHIPNCPPGRMADKIICREEIEVAFEAYLLAEDFPGAADQKVDSKVLVSLISFYLSGKAIDADLVPLSQEVINSAAEVLIAYFEKKRFEFPKFEIEKFELFPAHIVEQKTLIFRVRGRGVKDIKVKVLNLRGEQVFESERIFGKQFEWHLHDNRGKSLPNGFYFYVIEARDFEEEIYESPKGQFIIRL